MEIYFKELDFQQIVTSPSYEVGAIGNNIKFDISPYNVFEWNVPLKVNEWTLLCRHLGAQKGTHAWADKYIFKIIINVVLKPQSNRIVWFLDRAIGCDWAKVRPIGNVCYDLQQRSHAAIDLYAWSRYHKRLGNIDGKSHRRKSCD